MRSLLSVLLIGVPVTLILCLVGLTHGLSEDAQDRARGIGADVVILASTVGQATSFSPATLPEALSAEVEKQPHVAMAMGVINQTDQLPLILTGVDMALFNRMSGGFSYIQGHDPVNDDDIVLDKYVAEQKNARLGDTVKVLNHQWQLVGIFDTGKLAREGVKLSVLQTLLAAHNRVGQIYVKVDDPKNIDAVVKELSDLLPSDKVETMAALIGGYDPNKTPGVKQFTTVIVIIGVVIGFFVVCLSMYMAVLQRTREIGILKALGAGKAFVLGSILLEAEILGVCGTIIGILLSFAAYALIRTLVPASIPMIIVTAWWPIAGVITLFGAALGSLYPGWHAASHDPIEALAYE